MLETLLKLCLSGKFPHQEIRWKYSILCSELKFGFIFKFTYRLQLPILWWQCLYNSILFDIWWIIYLWLFVNIIKWISHKKSFFADAKLPKINEIRQTPLPTAHLQIQSRKHEFLMSVVIHFQKYRYVELYTSLINWFSSLLLFFLSRIFAIIW